MFGVRKCVYLKMLAKKVYAYFVLCFTMHFSFTAIRIDPKSCTLKSCKAVSFKYFMTENRALNLAPIIIIGTENDVMFFSKRIVTLVFCAPCTSFKHMQTVRWPFDLWIHKIQKRLTKKVAQWLKFTKYRRATVRVATVYVRYVLLLGAIHYIAWHHSLLQPHLLGGNHPFESTLSSNKQEKKTFNLTFKLYEHQLEYLEN